MEQLSHIFSIGHGSKDIKELILELQSFDIEFLVDIRSKPYSKFYTHFNQGFLKYSVEEYHIKYGYMGDLLGGLPLDRTCYTDGKVDYNKLKNKEFFIEGLKDYKMQIVKDLMFAFYAVKAIPKNAIEQNSLELNYKKWELN